MRGVTVRLDKVLLRLRLGGAEPPIVKDDVLAGGTSESDVLAAGEIPRAAALETARCPDPRVVCGDERLGEDDAAVAAVGRTDKAQ